MRFLRNAALAAALSLGLVACGGGGDTTEPANGGSEPVETTETTPPAGGDTLTITAPVGSSNTGFAEKELSAPADTPLTIIFKNDDTGIPHNVQIFEGTDTTATPVFAPADNELITGVAETTYEVPALPAGTYTYNCFSHPATMVGTLTVA
jgi:plastocyanin